MKKILFLGILCIAFGILFLPNRDTFVSQVKTYLKHDPVRLLFVGDVMLSRHIGVLIERNDAHFPFELVKEEITRADIAFANFENPVSEGGINQGSRFSFRASPEVISGLTYAGFDIVSLANNHILDYGGEALIDSVSLLKNAGIEIAGAGETSDAAYEPAILEAKGMKIAYFAYSEFSGSGNTVASTKSTRIFDDISEANEIADFVVVSVHWGDEYETKQNDAQIILGRKLIDSGADLVIGHHPHVTQEVEEYKGGLIAYSLGNFVFDQNFSEDTRSGMVLEVAIQDGSIVGFVERQVRFNQNFQPFFTE